ncbi:MAG: peptidoglycan-binding protein [Betaproteobacteria bacterium]|nr:peptidoglycan-binding protein [Betaproteobacteria bacterium]
MHLTSWTRGISSLLLLLPFTVGAAANDAAPVVTIVEGRSTLASGLHGYIAVPGMQLRQCEIVQTGPQSLVQVEFPDGSRIELGPDSRFLSDVPTPVGSARAIGPYFLGSGWLKLTVAKRDNAPPYRINTPYFDLVMNSGVAVLNVADGGRFFIEQGSALALDASGARGGGAGTSVAANQTYSRKSAESRPGVVNRADPAFVKSMPPSFRDTLPAMYAKVKGRTAQLKPAPDYDYAAVSAWLNTHPELHPCIAGDLVRSVQEMLKREGLDVGPIDGILGPRTAAALREFQQQHGLARSGEPDEATLKELSKR